MLKYVDGQGNEIDTAVTVKDNVIVEKATTKVYADREETTYTATNEEYSTVENRKEVIEVMVRNINTVVYMKFLISSITLQKKQVR